MPSEDTSAKKKGFLKSKLPHRKQREEASDHQEIIPGSFATLNELIDTCAEKYQDLPAVGMALEESLTYREMHLQILALAAQIQAEGIAEGDRVAILAENSHNWGIAYFSLIRAGAIAVPILPDLPESDVHHILTEMKCPLIFITQRQIEKIYEQKNTLNKVITLDNYSEDNIIADAHPFSAFLHEATENYLANQGDISFPDAQSTDIASILYTSGTSGFSKAVMLTHYNLCANAFSASKLIDIDSGKTFLSVLPISHTYEFTVGFLLPLVKGCRIIYAGKTPTPAILQKICSRERPHAMLVVPLIMEKIFKKRVQPAIEKSKLLSLVCRTDFGRKIIYKKIGRRLLDFFGGNLEVMGIGGAAINPDVESFLQVAGFPYIVGYGLTEASPLLAGGPQGDQTISIGSSGKPVPHVEVRINNPDPDKGVGEIQAKGFNVMQGYWKDPEATADTFTEDGWLKTGDMGKIDGAGNLHILGRSKSVIVLASGENIYPEAIEHKINSYPFVVESLVLENNGLIEAWVYPDYEYVDAETMGQSRQQRHQYITAQLEKMRVEVNQQLQITSRLSRVVERREPFIKTATHKIKRYLYSENQMDG